MLRFFGFLLTTFTLSLGLVVYGTAQNSGSPKRAFDVVQAFQQAQWMEIEPGLQVIRANTQTGTVVTAFRISQENFSFSVVQQNDQRGSKARDIGESEGAVLVSNAGFFAINGSETLYPIGYLRLNGDVKSKGWADAGGVVSLKPDGLELSPSHAGLPDGEFDVVQSKPMLIEPSGKWAMGSNSGDIKARTVLCTMANGDVILATVTRVGLTLYEAGWVMRDPQQGGFFGCDAALAFDGGRSTQVWYSGDEQYSFNGLTPVQNFFVVRQREEG